MAALPQSISTGLEQDKAAEAMLEGKAYRYILDAPTAGKAGPRPKMSTGKLDHNAAMTGDDLRDFVDRKLFPYLHGFKQRASWPQHHRIQDRRGLSARSRTRSAAATPCATSSTTSTSCAFRSQTEKHELSRLYEAKIKRMGNAGRNGGEYYPRAR